MSTLVFQSKSLSSLTWLANLWNQASRKGERKRKIITWNLKAKDFLQSGHYQHQTICRPLYGLCCLRPQLFSCGQRHNGAKGLIMKPSHSLQELLWCQRAHHEGLSQAPRASVVPKGSWWRPSHRLQELLWCQRAHSEGLLTGSKSSCGAKGLIMKAFSQAPRAPVVPKGS